MKYTRRGSVFVESAMWVPILVLLVFGLTELGRVSYTYYTLQKTLFTMGAMLSQAQGIKAYAVRGGIEDNGETIISGLTSDLIQIRIERVNAESGLLEECDCSTQGCDTSSGGQPPDFIVLSIPDGFPVRLVFPSLNLDAFPLRPQVRVPYGGT